jgi:hypothetical protein
MVRDTWRANNSRCQRGLAIVASLPVARNNRLLVKLRCTDTDRRAIVIDAPIARFQSACQGHTARQLIEAQMHLKYSAGMRSGLTAHLKALRLTWVVRYRASALARRGAFGAMLR